MLHPVYGRLDNQIVSAVWDGDRLRVTLNDGREVLVPSLWFTWLKNSTPDQRQNFAVYPTMIVWDEFDNAITLEVLLLGRWTPPAPNEVSSSVSEEIVKQVSMPEADWTAIQQLANHNDITLNRWMQFAAIEKAAKDEVRLSSARHYKGKRGK